MIYDQICEPLHFCYILGATLNAFKVTPITSIIMASFVDYERSMYPTDWHNQIDIVMVIGCARPVPQVDVATWAWAVAA